MKTHNKFDEFTNPNKSAMIKIMEKQVKLNADINRAKKI